MLSASLLSACGVEEAAPLAQTPSAPVQEQTVPEVGQVSAAVDLDCSRSPFGKQLLVGGEFEAYVGYRGSDGKPSAVVTERAGSSGSESLTRLWAVNPYSQASAMYTPKSVAADLNGDGKSELVQGYKDTSGVTRLMVHTNDGTATPALSSWTMPASTFGDYLSTELAAGNLDRSDNLDDELIWAFIDSSRNIQLYLLDGNGAGGIGTPSGQYLGYWFSDGTQQRTSIRYLHAATGDLDGNGFKDEIVLMFQDAQINTQLVVLKYDPTLPSRLGGYSSKFKEIATYRFEHPGTIGYEGQLSVGSVDGDFKDEIVVAMGLKDPDSTMNTQLDLRIFNLVPDGVTAGLKLVQNEKTWQPHFRFDKLDMAIGDTDADGVGEIALAFRGFESTITDAIKPVPIGVGFNALTLDMAEDGKLLVHNAFFSDADSRKTLDSLSLAVGDMDRDGLQDLVAAFSDAGGALQVVRLEDAKAGGTAMTLLGAQRNTDRSSPNAVRVTMGDWRNDSLRARYTPVVGSTKQCQRHIEPQLSSAIFVPPFWQNINADQVQGSIGQSRTHVESTETSVGVSNTHSVSAYIGYGAEIPVLEIGASLKVTGGYEWEASRGRSIGTELGSTLQTSNADAKDFAVFQQQTYNCYSYELVQESTALANSGARFCEFQYTQKASSDLLTWETKYKPENEAKWAPIVRDWSNLALFRAAFVSQSSDGFGGVARRAVDNNTDGVYGNGSVTHTQLQDAPWWQIDLGESTEVRKVRLWNRSNLDVCPPELTCRTRLKNIHVFVSDTDFTQIPGNADPAVLARDPRVKAYYYPYLADERTTILTSNAGVGAKGRFVRVQLADKQTYLSLAEVQVFGPDHIEPDRYPVDAWDPIKNDGKFNVTLYNRGNNSYETVSVRGNLLWDSQTASHAVDEPVSTGSGVYSWSLLDDQTSSTSTEMSVGNTWRVGTERDAELLGIQGGASYEYSSSMTRSSQRTLSTGEGFELGGSVGGFPSRDRDNKPIVWPSGCTYEIRPYYYEVTERGNTGYTHRFLVVDYLVPARMSRTSPDLPACRAGQSNVPAFAPPSGSPATQSAARQALGG